MRNYLNYDEYITHQSEKLKKKYSEALINDKRIENLVYIRYKDWGVESASVLCLGARLGGEVRAFKKLGSLAIGIDLNPGKKNKDVLYGDFHDIQFQDNTFDVVYCNSIDHSLYLDKILKEVYRVLKLNGIFLCEVAIQRAGEYETIDTTDIQFIEKEINELFEIRSITNINNGWKGKLIRAEKYS